MKSIRYLHPLMQMQVKRSILADTKKTPRPGLNMQLQEQMPKIVMEVSSSSLLFIEEHICAN